VLVGLALSASGSVMDGVGQIVGVQRVSAGVRLRSSLRSTREVDGQMAAFARDDAVCGAILQEACKTRRLAPRDVFAAAGDSVCVAAFLEVDV